MGGCGADVVVASLLVEDVADVSSEVCGVVAEVEKAEEEISSECRLADMDDASPSLEVMEAEEFVWFLVFFPLLFGIVFAVRSVGSVRCLCIFLHSTIYNTSHI